MMVDDFHRLITQPSILICAEMGALSAGFFAQMYNLGFGASAVAALYYLEGGRTSR